MTEKQMMKLTEMAFISKPGEIRDYLREQKLIADDIRADDTRPVKTALATTKRWVFSRLEQTAKLEEKLSRFRIAQLSEELKSSLELMDIRIVPGGACADDIDYAELTRAYGEAAARYFDAVAIHDEQKGLRTNVLISGGQTILEMAMALPDRERPKVSFIAAAMIGRGKFTKGAHVGPETNATIAWSRSGRISGHLKYGTTMALDYEPPPAERRIKLNPFKNPAPPSLAATPSEDDVQKKLARELRHNIAREKIMRGMAEQLSHVSVQNALEDMDRDNVNMAIAGLGLVHVESDKSSDAIQTERLTMTELLRPYGLEPDLLREEGAVGDLSYCLFDEDGVGSSDWNLFLTPGHGHDTYGVNFYRAMVTRGDKVVVMAGEKKWEALIAAVGGRLFNVLVTDEVTANRLLEWQKAKLLAAKAKAEQREIPEPL